MRGLLIRRHAATAVAATAVAATAVATATVVTVVTGCGQPGSAAATVAKQRYRRLLLDDHLTHGRGHEHPIHWQRKLLRQR
jgi:hypothetical protein